MVCDVCYMVIRSPNDPASRGVDPDGKGSKTAEGVPVPVPQDAMA